LDAAELPRTSVAPTRRSYRPSATPLVVSQLAVYGNAASVEIVCHEEVPAGAYWNVTCWTEVSVSLALALRATVPRTGLPGSVNVDDGPRVSTFAVTETPLETLPTLSAIVNVYR